jgi:hypothetical protein
VLDEQVAHVVGRAARRQLVKHLMGEGGVACQVTQNTVDVRLANPCQTTVGAVHRGERVDDDLQLRRDHTGVGVSEQSLGCRAEHAALASSTAVELGFSAAAGAVHVELHAAAAPTCGPTVDQAG